MSVFVQWDRRYLGVPERWPPRLELEREQVLQRVEQVEQVEEEGMEVEVGAEDRLLMDRAVEVEDMARLVD